MPRIGSAQAQGQVETFEQLSSETVDSNNMPLASNDWFEAKVVPRSFQHLNLLKTYVDFEEDSGTVDVEIVDEFWDWLRGHEPSQIIQAFIDGHHVYSRQLVGPAQVSVSLQDQETQEEVTRNSWPILARYKQLKKEGSLQFNFKKKQRTLTQEYYEATQGSLKDDYRILKKAEQFRNRLQEIALLVDKTDRKEAIAELMSYSQKNPQSVLALKRLQIAFSHQQDNY